MRQFFLHFTLLVSVFLLTVVPPKTIAAPFSSKHAVTAPQTVSMVQLIANPKKYQGKQVRVIGYFVYWENDFYKPPLPLGGLYLSKDLAVHRSYENGISIGFENKNLILEPNEPTLKERLFDNKYVAVEGTFSNPLDYSRFRSHLQVNRVQMLKAEQPARIEQLVP